MDMWMSSVGSIVADELRPKYGKFWLRGQRAGQLGDGRAFDDLVPLRRTLQ
jgi:hypothetical protein